MALLALSAGHPVGVDRLVSMIWPEEGPERARPTLQTLVARARVEVPGAIVTTANGYLLDVDPENVDLLRFRRLVREAGMAGEPDTARELLDQALELWRGEPLGDVRSSVIDRDLVPSLTDERLSAVHWRADLNLSAGRNDQVITELRDLTSHYPLRERLWAQFISALAGAGRRAEAIEQYHQARGALADELGVDPSPGLQDLYLRLLQSDPRGASAGGPPDKASSENPDERRDPLDPRPPRQLPAGIAGFAGRADQLKLLSEMADEVSTASGSVGISVICGMAGVGKTALAVHWAHQAEERFPDGQLYADLRGFDPSGEPAASSEVICRFLDTLGVPSERIPRSLDAQAGLYRTLLAERQILVVLDNARDAAQVWPLLPGSSGCMVVVTSRNPLTYLAASFGAQMIRLDVLTDDEAGELLSMRLGEGRMRGGHETAMELAALCGRLPLALAITAARAAARPGLPLAYFAAELRDARKVLDVLDAGDPARSLRAVLSWSSHALSHQAVELLQLLSIHPGPDISLPAAASLAGEPDDRTGIALQELVALHLVTEQRRDRFILHDLVRAYAAEQAEALVPINQRRDAVGRMLGYYLHTSQAGDATLNPACRPIPAPLTPALEGCVPESIDTRQQATDWFETEHRVLVAITALAAGSGFEAHAWQLPMAFYRYLDWHGYWDDWDAIQRAAHGAVEQFADKAARACVRHSSGVLSLRLGSYTNAHKELKEALDLYAELDDPVGQARTLGDLSMLLAVGERYDEALVHSERALMLSAAADNAYLHAAILNKVGWHAAHLGDYPRALTSCEEALALQQSLGNRPDEAFVWNSLGYIHEHLQDYDRSVECFHHAVRIFREFGNRPELAATLCNLGDACQSAGFTDRARSAWQQAVNILEATCHPSSASVHAKLYGISPDDVDPASNQIMI